MNPRLSVVLPDINLVESELNCTCKQAHDILALGIETCQRLCDIAEPMESIDKAILLRSALIFGCSTLDSVGKRMVQDCLEEVINNDEGAQKIFESFISRQIKKEPEKVLARALSKPDYRSELIHVIQESVYGTSLQSYSQISELTAKFGIATSEVVSEDAGRKIFEIRQLVIHELDMNPDGSGTQLEREPEELVSQCDAVLKATANLIKLTHQKIHKRPVTVKEHGDGDRTSKSTTRKKAS